jgi:hypothetical protein
MLSAQVLDVVLLIALFSVIITAIHENSGPMGALRFFWVCFAGILALMFLAAALGSALHNSMFAE